MSKLPALPLAALAVALALPCAAQAQDTGDLPPLAPMSESEVRALPQEYRTAPALETETVTNENGVETITRTRRIPAPGAAPAQPYPAAGAYDPTPVVFERDQWIDECKRRTARRHRHGDRDDADRYDCAAALDAFLDQYGMPAPRIASREIPYAAYPAYGYGYPAYPYGYSYAPPQQVVMVPVRTEVQQQVVVRETAREETYTVPGTRTPAERVIPAPRPSAKMIKSDR
ncbi:MAG: hypothetical protein GC147_12080 [Porphyrobacter sp.]|nr:hypothetical protein [Porphyrobacter sp.]